MPVDLFGLPADYDAILPIAEKNKLWCCVMRRRIRRRV